MDVTITETEVQAAEALSRASSFTPRPLRNMWMALCEGTEAIYTGTKFVNDGIKGADNLTRLLVQSQTIRLERELKKQQVDAELDKKKETSE